MLLAWTATGVFGVGLGLVLAERRGLESAMRVPPRRDIDFLRARLASRSAQEHWTPLEAVDERLPMPIRAIPEYKMPGRIRISSLGKRRLSRQQRRRNARADVVVALAIP